MMKSKEFYEESISRLQKMVKHGVYVLLFDVFLVDSKRQLDMYKADMKLYYTSSLED